MRYFLIRYVAEVLHHKGIRIPRKSNNETTNIRKPSQIEKTRPQTRPFFSCLMEEGFMVAGLVIILTEAGLVMSSNSSRLEDTRANNEGAVPKNDSSFQSAYPQACLPSNLLSIESASKPAYPPTCSLSILLIYWQGYHLAFVSSSLITIKPASLPSCLSSSLQIFQPALDSACVSLSLLPFIAHSHHAFIG